MCVCMCEEGSLRSDCACVPLRLHKQSKDHQESEGRSDCAFALTDLSRLGFLGTVQDIVSVLCLKCDFIIFFLKKLRSMC